MSEIILKETYLNGFHKKNNAKFIPFSGYSMPINYELGIINENLQVRNKVGLFDVSHMGQILIPLTKHNIENLKKFIPLDFDNLKINKSYYSFILNENAGIIDDLIISKIYQNNKEFFYIVYNASRKNEDEKIFKKNLNSYEILVNNSLIAIQGPESNNILSFLKIEDKFLFMSARIIIFLNKEIIITRTGYTGEDGYEISVPNEIVMDFINTIMKNKNIRLCGLGARDSLRLEAGLSLYGNELNEKITPIEAGLKWALHFNRLNDNLLNGNKILLSQYNKSSNKSKIGVRSKSKIILRSNMKILDNELNEIGFITSGGFSPTLNYSIGIGYIKSDIKININICVLIRGRQEELEIVKTPFIKHKYNKGKIYG